MTIAKKVGARLTERGLWREGMRDVVGTRYKPFDIRCGLADHATPDLTDWPTLGVLIGDIVATMGQILITPGGKPGRTCATAGGAGACRAEVYADSEGEAIGALWLEVMR